MLNFVVIFTGGTGGHVLPSVSFGNHLIDNGYKCILITDSRGKILKNSHDLVTLIKNTNWKKL